SAPWWNVVVRKARPYGARVSGRWLAWFTAIGAVLSPLAATQTARAEDNTTIDFADVTASAHLTAVMPSADPLKGAYVHAAAWGDVNGDGYPDLYVGMFTDSRRSYYQFRGANGPSPNRLFLNNRNGTFTVESDSPPSALTGRTAGAVFADVDND